jgi:predicted ATPase with chaperone activity
MAEVKGQDWVQRALENAAAGAHNAFMLHPIDLQFLNPTQRAPTP